MRKHSKSMLPQRHTNKGAPAAGAGKGVSFDEATNQQAILRKVYARIGDLARQRPGGLDAYPAVMSHRGMHMPKGSQVTAGKSRRDIASYGASGGRTGKPEQVHPAEAVGISPSIVMTPHKGVRTSAVPSALAGRRRKHR